MRIWGRTLGPRIPARLRGGVLTGWGQVLTGWHSTSGRWEGRLEGVGSSFLHSPLPACQVVRGGPDVPLNLLLSYKIYPVILNFQKAAAAAAKSLQSCPTLCDPIDSSPPGSPVPGILQARTLEYFVYKGNTSSLMQI